MIFEDALTLEPQNTVPAIQADTLTTDSVQVFSQPKPTALALLSQEKLRAGRGVKSVIFDQQGEYLYALNLEDMSVFEFERETRSLNRQLIFEQTSAKGFDYMRRKWFDSYAEKPVEACFSHGGKYLWVSLHNAGGIVAWNLKGHDLLRPSIKRKEAVVRLKEGREMPVYLPFVKTGKTPKVIQLGPEGKHLFISNWHDRSVTVVDISSSVPEKWKVLKTIETGSVPRGLAVSKTYGKLYVAHMGGGDISVIDCKDLSVVQHVRRGRTPRHLLVDEHFLYASLSSPEKLIKINLTDLVTTAEVTTYDDPRTIAFSGDRSLVFVTCYTAERLQVFGAEKLNPMGSWPSKGKPVGVAVYQHGNLMEAWVCNYTGASIRVFSFEATYEMEGRPMSNL